MGYTFRRRRTHIQNYKYRLVLWEWLFLKVRVWPYRLQVCQLKCFIHLQADDKYMLNILWEIRFDKVLISELDLSLSLLSKIALYLKARFRHHISQSLKLRWQLDRQLKKTSLLSTTSWVIWLVLIVFVFWGRGTALQPCRYYSNGICHLLTGDSFARSNMSDQ